ncbi:MAG: hypothetical protein V4552_05525 [Pseudomonadota bacterium]
MPKILINKVNFAFLLFIVICICIVLKGPIKQGNLIEVRGVLVECRLEKYRERTFKADIYKPILKLRSGQQYWSDDVSDYGVERLNAEAPARIKFYVERTNKTKALGLEVNAKKIKSLDTVILESESWVKSIQIIIVILLAFLAWMNYKKS